MFCILSTLTFVSMPNILYPHVCASCEEQPMYRYEEKTQHVRSQGYADEENRKRQTLVFEAVVDATQQQVERP